MTQLRSVICHMGSHSVTFYPTQVNTFTLLHPSPQPDRLVLDLPTI